MNAAATGLACVLLMTGLAACSTVHDVEEAVADVEQGSAETAAFALTAAQAEQVILAAIREGWPDKTPERSKASAIAFQFQLHFAIDREHIIAEALPSDGGFRFRVTNRGTAPAVGVPARKKLVALLESHARRP